MAVDEPPHIAVQGVRYYVRNVHTRMPFRYGTASLTAVPVLHVCVDVEAANGRRARGLSADCLPPRWFDKHPTRDFAANISDMLAAVTMAGTFYEQASARGHATVFALWRECYERIWLAGNAKGLTGLTAAFGSSLLERAVIDAVCNLVALPFFEVVRRNLFGLLANEVHDELAPDAVQRALPGQPASYLWVRHTIGMADPIRTQDIPSSERLNDGLPQSLEECIREYGLRYFKVKVSGDPDGDWERLTQVAGVLHAIPEPYHVSLDGNEQYRSAEGLLALLRWMREGNEAMRRLRESILYIEQPFERTVALEPDMEPSVRALSAEAPVVIDESDDMMGAFRVAADMGYAGTSVKNCKGVMKGLLNLALVRHLNAQRAPACPYFLTVEDLMNVGVVPLQQDLTTAAALGVTHAERNGHHYVRGLAHLSPAERAQCLRRHPHLYTRFGDGARVAIRGGRLDVRSLQVPGYGLGVDVDLGSMVPLEDWRFDSLGV